MPPAVAVPAEVTVMTPDWPSIEKVLLATAGIGGAVGGFLSHRNRQDVKEGKAQLDGISLAIGEIRGAQTTAEASRGTMQKSIETVNFNLGGVRQQVEHVEKTLGNFGGRLGNVETKISAVSERLAGVEGHRATTHGTMPSRS